jgi:hypothetical protein
VNELAHPCRAVRGARRSLAAVVLLEERVRQETRDLRRTAAALSPRRTPVCFARGAPPHPPPPTRPAGGGRTGRERLRTRSHRRCVQPSIHVIPYSRRDSVPLFLKRQCDRARDWRGRPRSARPWPGTPRRPGTCGRTAPRVTSDCHFAAQLNHFIPGFL